MDIKERKAFEEALSAQTGLPIENLHICTVFDANKNIYTPSDVCDPKDDVGVHRINIYWDIWQAAKAQAVPEENALLSATLDAVQKLGSGEFVLLKNNSKTIVAIKQMVEQQIEASGMDSRCLERLDGEKILQAAIEAQEST